MSGSLPKISVVMPVLNRVDTIEKAIKSVIDQAYPQIELIIMDGGSSDGTVEIIKKYSDFIHYWQSAPDGNPVIAYNHGIQKATGDLVVILMADDWYELNTFHKIAQSYTQHPDADIFTVAGRIVSWDEKNKCYKPHLVYDNAKVLELSLYNVCFAVSVICCRFIKKSLYDQIGLYEAYNAAGKYVFSNDKEFLLRAILYGVKNVYVDHLGHHYLAHTGSTTFGNNKANIMRLCSEHMEYAQDYLQKENLTFKQRLLFIYWYNDQATRLLLYKLLDGDVKAVVKTAVLALKKYHVIWPFAFVGTVCKILFKRSYRLLNRVDKA